MMFHFTKFAAPRNAFAVALLLASATAVAQTLQSIADNPVQESAATRLAASSARLGKDQVAKHLESVHRLMEASASARQIETSRNPQAISLREDARRLYDSARIAYDAGDFRMADHLLDETSKTMFKAVSVAAPESINAKKAESDFRMREESVKTLLSAYKRIAAEKPASKGTADIAAQVEKNLAEANRLANAGKYAEGRAELDRAYAVLKTGVRGLREGDTLVRSLNFATREEEYRYELDRNDTHHMLIKLLVDDRRAASPDLDRQVSAFVAKAKELRTAAEASAGKKDYAAAIKLLEDSTAELVKAIRSAGVYIPG